MRSVTDPAAALVEVVAPRAAAFWRRAVAEKWFKRGGGGGAGKLPGKLGF